ncbi:MAG TPA: metallophosphoesterase [Kofleriaceae bacterium]|nr:metallophosphoesterase [Kofleriaceae bacterium]
MARLTAALLLVAGAACGKHASSSTSSTLADSSGLPAPVDGDFTIVLIPDTQYYTVGHMDLFHRQIQWIVDNAERLHVVFAIHEGDMTNDNTEAQWKLVDQAMRPLDQADIPWSPMPGNHDGIKKGVIDSRLYNKYFGIDRFAARPWYGGHYGDGNDSTFWLFSAGGMDFMVLSLAFGTPDEQLAWAGQVAAAHPDRRVIFATHALLDDDGTWLERGEEYGVEHPRWNDGRQIWEKLLRSQPNIFLTVCGHVPGQGKATVDNQEGRPVHHVLANYQGYPEGGNGWLRLLRFSPSRNQIYVEAYSPTLDRWDRADDQSFALDYSMP